MKFTCKGYIEKGDTTPIIRYECEAKDHKKAFAAFDEHLKRIDVRVGHKTVCKQP